MARSRAARATAVVVSVLLAGAGAYATADAYDVVPGLVTLEPEAEPAPPYPTAPAAVTGPDVVPVVGVADPAAPVPDAAALTAAAQAAVDHRWMGASTAVVVRDVLSGETLVDLAGGTPREPASTAKLLTVAAAVTALDPDATLRTRVVADGAGRLVLVGGGDMMLSAGAGEPEATNGRAGLVDLAAQVVRELRLAGTAQVEVAVDDTLFSGPALNPGWTPEHSSLGYVAPVAPVAVNIAKTREEPYPPRHADPALHAARTFADLLAEQGIAVSGVVRGTAPSSARELGAVESATVREIARYALHTSDNTVTEVLGRLVAVEAGLPGSFEGATKAVLAAVGAAGVDTTGARLADASGLAAGSLVPATTLVDLLTLAADGDHPELLPVAVDSPVSGWQGTLADRLLEGPARGLVRAKTGSLPGTTTLAGTVLTVEGRLLAFAVMTNETPPGGQLGPRRVIDALVQQMAGCDCPLP